MLFMPNLPTEIVVSFSPLMTPSLFVPIGKMLIDLSFVEKNNGESSKVGEKQVRNTINSSILF